MEQSLFDKYGGFSTIHQVVEGFYDGVLENEILAHISMTPTWQH